MGPSSFNLGALADLTPNTPIPSTPAQTWEVARLADERRNGLVLPALGALFFPLTWWASQGGSLLINVGGGVSYFLVEAAFLATLVWVWRAKTLRSMRWSHLFVQLSMIVLMVGAGPSAELFWPYVLLLSMMIWAPQAAFAWPMRVAAPMFVLPPLAFGLRHLLLAHDRTPESVIAAMLYLSFSATVCIATSTNRWKLLRREFEATQQLAAAKEETQASLHQLVAAQAQLVQSEKMASLGQLVAGVAHELNTPLGAIGAFAEDLDRGVRTVIQDVLPSLGDSSQADRDFVSELLAVTLSGDATPLSSREERTLRRRYTADLDATGVDDAREVAEALIEVGFRSELGEWAGRLTLPGAPALLSQARTLASMQRNAQTIRQASDRAAGVVVTLKTYAHPGGVMAEPTMGAISDHLDTVLRLHGNQIRDRVELIREDSDPGAIWARHDQLNQVWTNLINNALHAMEHKGVLTLGVHREQGSIRVDVIDSGHGMSDEVKERIFESFFTTKPPGEGSGLGLSICWEIVEGHGGRFEVESEPGRTRVSVLLPQSEDP